MRFVSQRWSKIATIYMSRWNLRVGPRHDHSHSDITICIIFDRDENCTDRVLNMFESFVTVNKVMTILQRENLTKIR